MPIINNDSFEVHKNFLKAIETITYDGKSALICTTCSVYILKGEDYEDGKIPVVDVYEASMQHIHTRDHLITLRDGLSE